MRNHQQDMGYNYGNYYGAMMADTAGGGAGEYPGALQPNGQGMGGGNTLDKLYVVKLNLFYTQMNHHFL